MLYSAISRVEPSAGAVQALRVSRGQDSRTARGHGRPHVAPASSPPRPPSPDAITFARESNVNLLDVDRAAEPDRKAHTDEQAQLLAAPGWRILAPDVRRCGVKMVKTGRRARVAVRWGCSNYPQVQDHDADAWCLMFRLVACGVG
jgi:hypothetical protein